MTGAVRLERETKLAVAGGLAARAPGTVVVPFAAIAAVTVAALTWHYTNTPRHTGPPAGPPQVAR